MYYYHYLFYKKRRKNTKLEAAAKHLNTIKKFKVIVLRFVFEISEITYFRVLTNVWDKSKKHLRE